MHRITTAIVLLSYTMIWFFWSCTPEDEVISTDPSLSISFSSDTVRFDTILTDVQSITQRVRIFNPNDNAIILDRISLATANSPFDLTINGQEQDVFSQITLLGQDSLLVLVEANIEAMDQANPYLVKDSIIVEFNSRSEDIKVIAWGQDANFVTGVVIEEDVTWTAGKPYVITDFVIVDSLSTLKIEAGAVVLLEFQGAIFVQGKIEMLGTAEEPILVSNTRFDEGFADAPGQWDAIYILEGSEGNIVQHTTIRNGRIGLRVGTPDDNINFDLSVENSIIQNMSIAGIEAFTSDVRAVNTQINNCGAYLVGNFAGGNYLYEHCTFTNFPSALFREGPSVQFSDFYPLDNGEVIAAPLSVRVENSIIWGSEDEELALGDDGGQPQIFNLTNNILRSENPMFDVNGNILSQESNYPGFVAELSRDYRLDSLANARDIAIASDIKTDLLANDRDSLPDIGAYEWIPNQP